MKKKYKCRLSASSLLVNLKGKVIRLEFEPSVLSEFGLRGCAYTTDNKDLQYAIEHSARFNNHRKDEVWTDDKEPQIAAPVEVTVTPVVEEPKKVVRRVKAKKEA